MEEQERKSKEAKDKLKETLLYSIRNGRINERKEINEKVKEAFLSFYQKAFNKITESNIKTYSAFLDLFEDDQLDSYKDEDIERAYNGDPNFFVSYTHDDLQEKLKSFAMVNFNIRKMIVEEFQNNICWQENKSIRNPYEILTNRFVESMNVLSSAMLYRDLSKIYSVTDSIHPKNLIKELINELDNLSDNARKDEAYVNEINDCIKILQSFQGVYNDNINKILEIKVINDIEDEDEFGINPLNRYENNCRRITDQILKSIKETCRRIANLCDYYNTIAENKSNLNPFNNDDVHKSSLELSAWARDKFQSPSNIQTILRNIMGISEEIGEMTRPLLKQDQGIRGSYDQHEIDMADAMSDVCIFAANTFGQIATCGDKTKCNNPIDMFSTAFTDANFFFSKCLSMDSFNSYADTNFMKITPKLYGNLNDNSLCVTLADFIADSIEYSIVTEYNSMGKDPYEICLTIPSNLSHALGTPKEFTITNWKKYGIVENTFDEYYSISKTFIAIVEDLSKNIGIWIGQLTAMVASRTTIAQYFLSRQFQKDLASRHNFGMFEERDIVEDSFEMAAINKLTVGSNLSCISAYFAERVSGVISDNGIANIEKISRTKYAMFFKEMALNAADLIEDKRGNILIDLPIFEMTSNQYYGTEENPVFLSEYSPLINAFGFRFLCNPIIMYSEKIIENDNLFALKDPERKLRRIFVLINSYNTMKVKPEISFSVDEIGKGLSTDPIRNLTLEGNTPSLHCNKWIICDFDRHLRRFMEQPTKSYVHDNYMVAKNWHTYASVDLIASIHDICDSKNINPYREEFSGHYSDFVSRFTRTKKIMTTKKDRLYSPLRPICIVSSFVSISSDSFDFNPKEFNCDITSSPLMDYVAVINNTCFSFFINGYMFRRFSPAHSSLIRTMTMNDFHNSGMASRASDYSLAQTLDIKTKSYYTNSKSEELDHVLREQKSKERSDIVLKTTAEFINSIKGVAHAGVEMHNDLARVVNVMRAMFYFRHGFDLFISEDDIKNLTEEQKKYAQFAFGNVVAKILKRDWNKNPESAHKS